MKKLFLNSYFVLLSVLALGFSACTEEVEYKPAERPASDQVYFSHTNSTEIELKKEATEFSICVMRQNAEEELSVPVKFVADSLAQVLCTFPESVVFEKYSKVAMYTIKLNALSDFIDNENGYDKEFNITLSIDDKNGAYTTPYGNSTFTFKAFVPAPWTEWKQVNTGTYTLTCMWAEKVEEVPVYYREHMIDQTKAEYLFKMSDLDWFDIKVQYNKETSNCIVEPTYLMNHSTYGPVYFSDFPNNPFDLNGDGARETYEDNPCFYNKETGLFTLNMVYFVCSIYGSSANGTFGTGAEYMQLDGFTQYDYSFAFNYAGYYVDQKNTCNAVISTAIGKDLTQVAMTMVKAEDDIEAAFAGMIDGTLACDTLKQSGYMAYPVSESGNYVALAVSYDKDGKVLDSYTTEFEFFMPGQSSPWKSIGMATYTDDIITTFFNVPNETYLVEVLENTENPGLYRVMNAYGAAYPYNEDGDYDTSKDYFFEIDATDPEAVYIPGLYGTGMNWGYGEFEITSMAYYYMATQGITLEQAKEAGLCGTLVDGVITFPVKGLAVFMGDYSGNANANGAFKLDLNPAVEKVQDAQRSTASRMFNKELNAEENAKLQNINNKGKFFKNRPEIVLNKF